MLAGLVRPLRAAAELVLPTSCAVCGRPAPLLCPGCEAAARDCLFVGGPRVVRPDPSPAGMPWTVASGSYRGTLGRIVTAYKDEDRRDCRDLLAGWAGGSLDTALAQDTITRALLARGDGPVLAVPVPASAQSRRRRGDAPLLGIVGTAVLGFAPREALVVDALRLRRRVSDQAGLGALARGQNLEHAMALRGGCEGTVLGATCVLVDDVLTTGATLVEGRRALLQAGARHVLAATICATERRARDARRARAAPVSDSPQVV